MQILNPSVYQNINKSEESIFYVLKKNSKSLVSVPSDNSKRHRFCVGTFENSDSNQVEIISFDEESNTVSQESVVNNLLPVNQISDFYSTENETHLLVSFTNLSEKGSFLSLLSYKSDNANSHNFTSVGDKLFKKFKQLAVDPHSTLNSTRFSVITSDSLHIYSNYKEQLNYSCDKDPLDQYSSNYFVGKFDPHNKDLFTVSIDNYFNTIDLRQNQDKSVNSNKVCSSTSVGYHSGIILDINYNPNVPNELVTVGEDTFLLVWDLRNTLRPVNSFSTGHGHWVKKVLHNSFHDHLLLTSGSNGSFLHTINEGKLDNITTKSTSSNDICWSNDDAWIYCNLLNNNLRIDTVPKDIKYSLLS
ncbi:Protein TSSC1 [Theileria parva strain Muguga]|uniref:Protein TSSC1 n=1 Tax=Theileria parva strain Muguga TaxID=333668 RepID=UPI001C619989|nr:Protein TSSC1 [Theileria parva strain Muguga]EAN34241.2 Protein TSSC1 [Theileria parva strain Muguga]